MDAARFRRVKEVLVEALACAPADRAACLDAACAGDDALRAEVEDLLGREAGSSDLVSRAAGSAAAVQALAASAPAATSPSPPPDRIGPFRIVGVLGEGGMGLVYHGRQEEPIRRDVAVKVLRRGLDTDRILERFAWERRSLARMDHPHIARILDAGSDDAGRPYVALELVDGEPITRWCTAREASLDERLALMIGVCRAVQHAHDRGVLHRDLKPNNVMVRLVDGEAAPCVIDFGIAKALEPGDTELTLDGQVVGTPAYMSPEQRAGEHGRVGIGSDVYALGVILYELLAGCRPFGDGATAAERADLEPTPPSRTPPPGPGPAAGLPPRQRRRLRGDLDRICLMAIRPEPERRYRSALALADDLQRFREGRPVAASPDQWTYRLRKTARRHPAWVALIAAAAVFATAGVGFLGYHADRLARERLRAVEAEQLARREEEAARGIASFLEGLFTDIDPEQGQGGEVTARQLLDHGAERLAVELADQPLVRGRLLRIMGQSRHSMALHEGALELLDRSLAAYAAAPDTAATAAERAQLWALRGTTLYDLGRYAEAEADDRRALALIRSTAAGPTVFEVEVLADIATCLQAQTRLRDAIILMREAIALGEELGPEAAQSVAWARNNLGYFLYQDGAYAEARALFTGSLARQRELLPGDHMEVANSLNNLGGIELTLHDLDAAEASFAESYGMYRRIYTGGHPAVARAMNHLARIRLLRDDVAGAAALVDSAHAMNRAILGEEHVYTTMTMIGAARVRRAQGRAAAAESLLTEAVAVRLRLLGADHRRTREARAEWCRFLLAEGRDREAAAALAALMADEKSRLAPDHPKLGELRVDLAEADRRLGRRAEASALAHHALPGLLRSLGPDHPTTRRAQDLLASTE